MTIRLGILIGLLGVAVAGFAGTEHLARRTAERQLQETRGIRRQLERQLRDIVAGHQQLQSDLANERQRAHELSETLGSFRGQLEDTEGRLTEENRTVRVLRVRLAQLQEQIEQLQGELSIVLEEQQEDASPKPGAVEIERIVVSDAKIPASDGRVVSIHRDWDFVVINLGWDTVRIGDTVAISRDEELMAEARIDRVQEGICAATVLPEWETASIRVNDSVQPR